MTQPWQPITDPRTLRFLGKAGEETGELSSALSRCIIQGIDGIDPSTGKTNRQWLLEELADVETQISRVLDLLSPSHSEATAYRERMERKRAQMIEWEALVLTQPREPRQFIVEVCVPGCSGWSRANPGVITERELTNYGWPRQTVEILKRLELGQESYPKPGVQITRIK